MDRNALRERLLTDVTFRPKEKLIATPYFGDLDGEFKLVGITGKQMFDLQEYATEQSLDKDGKTVSKINKRKMIALTVAECLRVRSTGEPVYGPVDVLGENGDGNGALMELDSSILTPLIDAVEEFVGRKPHAEVKKSSDKTKPDSESSSSPSGSEEPQANSSTQSTQES